MSWAEEASRLLLDYHQAWTANDGPSLLDPRPTPPMRRHLLGELRWLCRAGLPTPNPGA